MKIKKILLIIYIMIIISIPVFAIDKVLVLDITIFRNDTIQMDSIHLDEGSESEEFTNSKTDYKVVLLDSKNSIIFQKYLQVSFSAIPDIFPGEKGVPTTIELDKVRLLLRISYSDDASKLRILRNEKILFEIETKLCNNNKICEVGKGENLLSCPKDCSSSSNDNYCDKVLDGRCDPDCAVKELDIDCTCGNKICELRENEKTCPSDCKLSLWQRMINFIKNLFK